MTHHIKHFSLAPYDRVGQTLRINNQKEIRMF